MRKASIKDQYLLHSYISRLHLRDKNHPMNSSYSAISDFKGYPTENQSINKSYIILFCLLFLTTIIFIAFSLR